MVKETAMQYQKPVYQTAMNDSLIQSPHNILKEKFGYSEFKYDQETVIQSVLNGKDVFVMMPTGGGKSLCYQIPALALEGLTVVVSPLIALMKDQVDALRVNGVEADFLNSTQIPEMQDRIMAKVRANKTKLLYVAPERLFSLTWNEVGSEILFLDFLKEVNVSLFAIDEAHCISQWGHDFRPGYLKLSQLKQHFPDVPVIALTASADGQTREDILQKLCLKDPQTFVSSFNRENIHYYVEPKRNSYLRLLDFIGQHADESGIVYVLSRKSAENLAADLEAEGLSAKPYHAGLDKGTRDQHQDMFIKDQVKIMVATIAFGMGINKSNVRFVVHMDLPKNIESYYQETGRAGRDGLKSDALLFYSYADVLKLRRFVKIDDNTEQSEVMLKKLDEISDFCQRKVCRRKYLLNYFGEKYDGNCNSCDICLDVHEKFDGTLIAQKALSAVSRLKENFGIGYVIDFLRGSESQKIREWHKSLITYGTGADISKNDWHRHIRDLIDGGWLMQSGDNYPVLQLTSRSNAVLRGEEKVMLIKAITRERAEKPKMEIEHEQELFQKLKTVRYDLAILENIPAYIVFSDSTLIELAAFLPHTLEEMQRISGFGVVKLEKYGEIFLKEVTGYCVNKGLTSRIHMKVVKRQRKGKIGNPGTSNTRKESLELFKSGKSTQEIAALRMLKDSTIESHLSHFILTGELDVEELVAPGKIQHIKRTIEKHNGLVSSPVKQDLGDAFTYGEIRAVVNHMKREKPD